MEALIAIIALALVFDYINGFHDAANSIATVFSTRVLSPRLAVAWAAFFNFIAFFFFESHVAGNIAKGVHANVVSLSLVGAGLVGAIVWDLITWWLALPTSSSHALLGGNEDSLLHQCRPLSLVGHTVIVAPLSRKPPVSCMENAPEFVRRRSLRLLPVKQ